MNRLEQLSAMILACRTAWSFGYGPATITDLPRVSHAALAEHSAERPCLPCRMSDSDFIGGCPAPSQDVRDGPLPTAVATASSQHRFSVLTMISGAPKVGSRLRRLLRYE